MFPLGTVLYPHMVLPLHVFEPRYRALVHDVLAGDHEFGVTLITRGHEVGGGDQRADIGSVARVLSAEELDDGRFVLLSVGIRRLRVVEWLSDDPYPRARIEGFSDPDGSTAALPDGTENRLRRVLAMHAELGREGVPATFDLEDDPAVASWQIAVIAPFTPYDAQRVLEAPTSQDRVQLVDELLRELEQTLALELRADEP